MKSRKLLSPVLATAVLAGAPSSAEETSLRPVLVTVDDLPIAGGGHDSPEERRQITDVGSDPRADAKREARSEVDLLPDQYKDKADSLVRGTDTMDVWFDSGSMPVAQWGYPAHNQEMFDEQYLGGTDLVDLTETVADSGL